MATTTATIDLPVPAARVWQLIGGFDSLPDWLPYIPVSTLSEGGRVRSLKSDEGGVIVERLEAFDNQARTYSYSILQAPFPVTGYRSTLTVHEVSGGEPRGVGRHLHAGRDERGRSDHSVPRHLHRGAGRTEEDTRRVNTDTGCSVAPSGCAWCRLCLPG